MTLWDADFTTDLLSPFLAKLTALTLPLKEMEYAELTALSTVT